MSDISDLFKEILCHLLKICLQENMEINQGRIPHCPFVASI